jgi:hypothetical protein
MSLGGDRCILKILRAKLNAQLKMANKPETCNVNKYTYNKGKETRKGRRRKVKKE